MKIDPSGADAPPAMPKNIPAGSRIGFGGGRTVTVSTRVIVRTNVSVRYTVFVSVTVSTRVIVSTRTTSPGASFEIGIFFVDLGGFACASATDAPKTRI